MILSFTRSSWPLSQAERQTPAHYAEAMASCAGRPCDRRALPRSVEVAVLPVDTGSGTGICRKALRHTTLRLDHQTMAGGVGFYSKKAATSCIRPEPEAVEQWVKKVYPLLRPRAKREHGLIYWGDEMGLRSDHTTGRTFSRRGQTPVIPGTGQRFRCNMISALTNKGQLCFMVFKKRFTTDVLLDFMKRLVRQNKRKVYLIVDKHPVLSNNS